MASINLTIPRVLAMIVIFIGIMVQFGWIADIPILTSILPQWVTMKFSTALSFFFSGVILYLIDYRHEKELSWSGPILAFCAMIVLFLMFSLLASSIFGVKTGIEDLFVKEAPDAVKTTVPGRPSIGTMVNFVLLASVAFFSLTDVKKVNAIRLIGLVVIIIGGTAFLGYILDLPILYYTVEGISTAMAFHTSILFVLLGTGHFLMGRKRGVSS